MNHGMDLRGLEPNPYEILVFAEHPRNLLEGFAGIGSVSRTESDVASFALNLPVRDGRMPIDELATGMADLRRALTDLQRPFGDLQMYAERDQAAMPILLNALGPNATISGLAQHAASRGITGSRMDDELRWKVASGRLNGVSGLLDQAASELGPRPTVALGQLIEAGGLAFPLDSTRSRFESPAARALDPAYLTLERAQQTCLILGSRSFALWHYLNASQLKDSCGAALARHDALTPIAERVAGWVDEIPPGLHEEIGESLGRLLGRGQPPLIPPARPVEMGVLPASLRHRS